jgi:hypothetical protein
LCLQGVQNFDNSIAVLGEALLGHLDVHLCAVLLQTQLGVLFKPPRGDLAFADPTQYRKRRGMVARVVCTLFGQAGEVVCQHLCAHAERFDEDFGEVNGDLSNHRGPDHPHGLGHG